MKTKTLLLMLSILSCTFISFGQDDKEKDKDRNIPAEAQETKPNS